MTAEATFELRTALLWLDGGFSETQLQYRTLEEGGHWGEWKPVPTVEVKELLPPVDVGRTSYWG